MLLWVVLTVIAIVGFVCYLAATDRSNVRIVPRLPPRPPS